MIDYIHHCNEEKGPVLFCVIRGKYAEGYDFKDNLCRNIAIIGVPNLPPSPRFSTFYCPTL